MADWGFLINLLVAFFVGRLMVLCVISERVWSDDLSRFKCYTANTICADMCYDYHFPISHITYWAMQLIFVVVPTLVYLVMFIENGRVKIKGNLLTYQFQLLLKILIEVASICGQWFLFGFEVKAEYNCIGVNECLDETTCIAIRPTEKTIFVRVMLAMACLSLLLNVLEMLWSCKRRNVDMAVLETAEEDPDSQPGYNTVMLENMEVPLRQNNDVTPPPLPIKRRALQPPKKQN